MLYRNLGITLTRRCNASCKICCFSSSPQCYETLDEDLLLKFILSCSEVEEIKTISFTGGEPFLCYEMMLRLAKIAQKIGKVSTVVSNCFWADNQDEASRKIEELKNSGMVRMNLSYDKWHSEYVAPENVCRVIRACKMQQIPVQIGMVSLREENIAKLIEILGEDALDVVFQTVPCLPVGAAKESIKDSQYIRHERGSSLPCLYNGNLVVFYNGKIYPCCSQMVTETSLVVGDYREDTVSSILAKIKNNGLLYLLRNRGIDCFIDEAERLGIPIPNNIVNQCEVCAKLFTDEYLRDFLPFVRRELKQYV